MDTNNFNTIALIIRTIAYTELILLQALLLAYHKY